MAKYTFVEVNLPEGRRSRVRADAIMEVRDDYVSKGTGKTRTKVPIVRVITQTGSSVTTEDETIDEFWFRLSEAITGSGDSMPLHHAPAAKSGMEVPDPEPARVARPQIELVEDDL